MPKNFTKEEVTVASNEIKELFTNKNVKESELLEKLIKAGYSEGHASYILAGAIQEDFYRRYHTKTTS